MTRSKQQKLKILVKNKKPKKLSKAPIESTTDVTVHEKVKELYSNQSNSKVPLGAESPLRYTQTVSKSYIDIVISKLGTGKGPEDVKSFLDIILKRMERPHRMIPRKEIDNRISRWKCLQLVIDTRQFESLIKDIPGTKQTKLLMIYEICFTTFTALQMKFVLNPLPLVNGSCVPTDAFSLERAETGMITAVVNVVQKMDVEKLFQTQNPYVLGPSIFGLMDFMIYSKIRVGMLFDGDRVLVFTVDKQLLVRQQSHVELCAFIPIKFILSSPIGTKVSETSKLAPILECLLYTMSESDEDNYSM